jgi:cysteinyl-tRNA synthetase
MVRWALFRNLKNSLFVLRETAMKNAALFLFSILLLISCSSPNDTVIANPIDSFYRQEMRQFIINLSQYSKSVKPGFYIIPQNGIQLFTIDGESTSSPSQNYLNAIDGISQEGLLYGYENDDIVTSDSITANYKSFLNVSKNQGKTILITDYCTTASKVSNSYFENDQSGYVSFSADQRFLTSIPTFPNPIFHQNNTVVNSLSNVKNFLLLLNFDNFSTKADFINAITATNYDLVVLDLYFRYNSEFTVADINQIRNKANGGKRLVFSYASIGEAEDYRYYWHYNWSLTPPSWLDAENPNWPGNFKVRYWEPEWQQIIYGNDTSYMKKIINAGFDGVYLDLVDSFSYYE